MTFERDLERMIAAYIAAALFSTSDESGGVPLDHNYDVDDVSAETRDAMAADCFPFLAAPNVLALIEDADNGLHFYAHGGTFSRAGHDLWFTRNGHGVGFWEPEWQAAVDPNGDLDKAARAMGGYDLYVSDDREVCGHGG